VQVKSLAGELRAFRLKIEHEAQRPLESLDLNGAFFLYALVAHLEFGSSQYGMIDGESGLKHIAAVLKRWEKTKANRYGDWPSQLGAAFFLADGCRSWVHYSTKG
jgi:hypothetical protein